MRIHLGVFLSFLGCTVTRIWAATRASAPTRVNPRTGQTHPSTERATGQATRLRVDVALKCPAGHQPVGSRKVALPKEQLGSLHLHLRADRPYSPQHRFADPFSGGSAVQQGLGGTGRGGTSGARGTPHRQEERRVLGHPLLVQKASSAPEEVAAHRVACSSAHASARAGASERSRMPCRSAAILRKASGAMPGYRDSGGAGRCAPVAGATPANPTWRLGFAMKRLARLEGGSPQQTDERQCLPWASAPRS